MNGIGNLSGITQVSWNDLRIRFQSVTEMDGEGGGVVNEDWSGGRKEEWLGMMIEDLFAIIFFFLLTGLTIMFAWRYKFIFDLK